MEALPEHIDAYIISFISNLEDLLAVSQLSKQFVETAQNYHYPLVIRDIEWPEQKWIKYMHAISRMYSSINRICIKRCNITESALSGFLMRRMVRIDFRECRQITNNLNWLSKLNEFKCSHLALAKCTKLPEFPTVLHHSTFNHLQCLLMDRLSLKPMYCESLSNSLQNIDTLGITNTDLYEVPLTFLTKMKNLKHLFLGGSNVFHRRLKHLLFNVFSIFKVIDTIEYQLKSYKNTMDEADSNENYIQMMANMDISNINNNDPSSSDAKTTALIHSLSSVFSIIHQLQQNGLQLIELTFWKTPNITMSKLRKYKKDNYRDVHFDGLSIAHLVFLHLLHKYYDSGLTILDFSVFNDNLKDLLAEYVDIKMAMRYVMDLATDSFGQTVLHRCCDQGWTEYAKHLLDCGVHSDSRDRKGATPLFQASVLNHYEIVHELIKNGADIFKRKTTKETPMEIACMRSNVETVEIMLESASADRFNENGQYDNQWSPVHCCCISGNVQILKLLIDSGLDYSSQNVWKQTPLHICAVKGYVGCAKVLVNRYNLKELLIKDEFGKTAEKIAAFNNKQNVVRLIRARIYELKRKREGKYRFNREGYDINRDYRYYNNGYNNHQEPCNRNNYNQRNGGDQNDENGRYYRPRRGRGRRNKQSRYYYRRKVNPSE